MNIQAKVFWILALSFVVGLVFDLIPFTPAQPQKLFLFVDGRNFGMTLEWYVYLAGEKISRMAIFYAFYLATGMPIVNTFFLIECMDLGDFMLIMNKPWTQILGVDVEFNTFKICILTYVFTTQWITQRSFGF